MIQKALNAVDQEYVVRLRRELHEYPELRFELPRTLALVRRELDAMGIPYTEEYGISAIVATINPQCKGFTIGLRADMDALPLNEKTDLTFYNRNREALYNGLKECGFECIKPEGAFYLFVKSPVDNEKEFCEAGKKYNILMVPGSSFACPGYVRLAYCVSYETIMNSLPKFKELAKEYF